MNQELPCCITDTVTSTTTQGLHLLLLKLIYPHQEDRFKDNNILFTNTGSKFMGTTA